MSFFLCSSFFFFSDTATSDIYPLSLHDALPISFVGLAVRPPRSLGPVRVVLSAASLGLSLGQAAAVLARFRPDRSEEHTSELQSHSDLVCRLLLEKKKINVNKQKNQNENDVIGS